MSGDEWSDEERERFVAAYRAATGHSEREARRMWDRLHTRYDMKRTMVWWIVRDWVLGQVPWIVCGSLAVSWGIAYVLGLPNVTTYALQTVALALGCSLAGFLVGTLAYLIWHKKHVK